MAGSLTTLDMGFGSSTAMDPVRAANESIEAALAGRTPAPQDLVLVFPTVDLHPQSFLGAAVQAAGDAQLAGCSSFAAFTTDAQVTCGTVAVYLPAAELSIGVAAVDSISSDIYGAAKRVTEQACDQAGGEGDHSVLMIFSDGLVGDQREVVRGSYAVTGATVPLVGGAAGERQEIISTYQFAEGKVMSNGLVAIWINSPRPLGVGVEHGWHPIGEPVMVTRAEGSIIYELDGQPAVQKYLSLRGRDLMQHDMHGQDAVSFSAMVLDHPLGLANASGRFDARHILDKTEDGGLVMFAHVSEQSVVQVMAGDSSDLVEAAQRASRDALDQLETPPRGGIVFSCAARVAALGDQLPLETAAVTKSLAGAPVAGFYTYGEFARVTGSTGFHNATIVVLAV